MTDNKSNDKPYRVVKTFPQQFFDETGRPVNGYQVDIDFMEFNEIHTFNVASLDKDNLKAKVEAFLVQRRALLDL